MPDSEGDFYGELCESTADVTLGTFTYNGNLTSCVGQILIMDNPGEFKTHKENIKVLNIPANLGLSAS